MVSKEMLIMKAWETSQPIKIYNNIKSKCANDVLIVSYTNKDTTFMKGKRQYTLKNEDFDIEVDLYEKFYRDMYCREIFGMDWGKLQSKLEDMVRNKECTTERISRTHFSHPTKVTAYINDIKVVAAMTYETITGIYVSGLGRIGQKYSVTSSQWENRII